MQFRHPVKAKHLLLDTRDFDSPLKEQRICFDKRSINRVLVNNFSHAALALINRIFTGDLISVQSVLGSTGEEEGVVVEREFSA